MFLDGKEADEQKAKNNCAKQFMSWTWKAAPIGGRGVYLINQFDFAENGIQISCMKEIYEMAETIIAWLGESGPKMGNSRIQEGE